MNSTEFRKQLIKIMPGYTWTIHRNSYIPTTYSYLEATGIQSSGFNRLSTLYVIRRETDNVVEYEVKSAGYGRASPWLSTSRDPSLARALRGLQDHYEQKATMYSGHASALKFGRKQKEGK